MLKTLDLLDTVTIQQPSLNMYIIWYIIFGSFGILHEGKSTI